MSEVFFCCQLANFGCVKEGGGGIHENQPTDHQRDSFKNSYSDSFYLLE